MRELSITTGQYINVYKDGVDMYVIINEANGIVDDHIIRSATTYLENFAEKNDLNDFSKFDLEEKLEKYFKYGVHIIKK